MPRLSESLPGTWELVAREDRTAAGELRAEPFLGSDPIAWLIYDRAGHFAAQFMKRDRSADAAPEVRAAGPNNTGARDGYDAYFGTYSVDDANGTVTQRLVGALSAASVGMVLTRALVVEGNALTIRLDTATPAGEAVTRTLTWRRVG